MDRYYRFSEYLKKRFGSRVQKVTVDAGFSCPNRDGVIDTTGCVYCDNSGFSVNSRREARPVADQIREGIQAVRMRTGVEKVMVYFQAYTNTYAPIEELEKIYATIRQFPEVVALAIGTRPDCVNDEILSLIHSYTAQYEVWIEYGLQSAHDGTLGLIHRGHDVATFTRAIELTRQYRAIKICAHIILGLPGETEYEMIETAQYVARLKLEGIKIHPLHVMKGTILEEWYASGSYEPMTWEEYVMMVIKVLEVLPPTMVIQRLMADCPADVLVAPEWIKEKGRIIGEIERHLVDMETRQGIRYNKS